MVVQAKRLLCRECGTTLSIDGDSQGLCPDCLAKVAPQAPLRHSEDPEQTIQAADVLDTLIDARLLTSYEVPAEEDHPAHHRVEVVHESLLSHWPRLVRWQMQDAEGAQLRDELRAQARLWQEHGRAEDFLWTGATYREYQVWRERYPGGLSAIEENFARAMTAHSEQRRRRRRIAVTAAFAVLLSVLAIVGAFWRRSVTEARRAEAAKLLAIAQVHLEDDPTEALAHTTASLELADNEEARVFVMKALAEAPPALVLDGLGTSGRRPVFSGDGRWLATAGHAEEVLVWSQDGSGPLRLPGHKVSPQGSVDAAWYEDRLLVTGQWTEGRARMWSIPGGELVREIDFGGRAWWQVGETHLLAEVHETDAETGHEILHLRSWRLPDGEAEELGTVDLTALGLGFDSSLFNFSGRGWIYVKGREIFYRPLPVRRGAPDRLVGRHDNEARRAALPDQPNRLWTRDAVTSELRLWDLTNSAGAPLTAIPRPADAWEKTYLRLDPSGQRFLGSGGSGVKVWDLEALPGSRGLHFRRQASWYASYARFHPGGGWLVASLNQWDEIAFWPLPERAPSIVEGYAGLFRPLAFSPDSRWLVTRWPDRSLRLWPLPGGRQGDLRVLHQGDLPELINNLIFDAAGERLVGTTGGSDLFVARLDGGPLQELEGFSQDHVVYGAGFSPSGRYLAAGTGYGTGIEKTLRVWNLETGEVRQFDLEQTKVQKSPGPEGPPPESGYEGGIRRLAFADESTLYTGGLEGTGVLRWDLETGTWERIVAAKPGQTSSLWLSGDRQQMITRIQSPPPYECGPGERTPLVLHDLRTGARKNLTTVVECEALSLAFDSSLTVYVTGQADGTLRVGRVGGDEPHLLAGHEGLVPWLAISPDLQWIASAGEDSTLRLWPMPDLDEPPLHTLPREELLAKLKSQTNVRAVRDPESSTGWSMEIGPFPGWEEVPTW